MATFTTRIAQAVVLTDGGLVVESLCYPERLAEWLVQPASRVGDRHRVANLAYGSSSTTLASRLGGREDDLSVDLANLAWGVVCLVLIILWRDVISWLGLAHLGLEGIYVAGLGCLEWRCRELLLLRS